jgi:hypothetical protein
MFSQSSSLLTNNIDGIGNDKKVQKKYKQALLSNEFLFKFKSLCKQLNRKIRERVCDAVKKNPA